MRLFAFLLTLSTASAFVAAAMGAGLVRWRSAIKVLGEVSDASAGN